MYIQTDPCLFSKSLLDHEALTVSSWKNEVAIFLLLYATLSWVADVGINEVQFILLSLSFLFFLFKSVPTIKRIRPLISLIIFSVTYLIFKNDLADMLYWHITILFVTALFLLTINDSKSDFQIPLLRVIKFITIIAIVSFPFMVLRLGFHEIPQSLIDEKQDFKTVSTFYGLVNHVVFVYAEHKNRIAGIFWEPTILAFFLIYFLLESKVYNLSLMWRVVFIIALVLTQSIGGIFLFIFLSILSVCKNSTVKLTTIVIGIGAIFSFSQVFPYLREVILVFFNRDIASDSSAILRIIEMYSPYYVTPFSLFGVDRFEEYLIGYHSQFGKERTGIINGLGSYYIAYGFVGLICILGFILRSISHRPRMMDRFIYWVFVFSYMPLLFSIPFLMLLITEKEESQRRKWFRNLEGNQRQKQYGRPDTY